MKRWMSFLLSLMLLTTGLAVPASAAAESADARLARVVALVKKALDLDTEAYTEFRGDVSEGEYCTIWRLRWSAEGASLNIEALEDGTVVSLWRHDGEQEPIYRERGLPAFPKLDVDGARAAAEALLARALAKGESFRVDNSWGGEQLNGTTCSFSGTVLLNGLPSPMSWSVTVRADNVVTSFNRDVPAQMFLGSVPSPTPAVAKDAAAKTLRGTLKMELLYVTDGDAKQAALRYVPVSADAVCVDAQTGELVRPGGGMTTYRNGFGVNDAAPMAEEGKAAGLTVAEQTGVEKLEGVLDRETLDKAVRAEGAYRLDGWTLASADYTLVREDDDAERVYCTIRYTLSDDEDYLSTRMFSVDARTGAVCSLNSGSRWNKDRRAALSADEAQKLAETFLARYSAHAAEFALRSTDDRVADGAPAYGFTFARKANGVFFPENSAVVRVDCMTGAICGLNCRYDEAVEFDGVEGIVSEDTATDAWMASFDTVLAYRLTPRELNAAVPAEKRLIDSGVTSFSELRLTYALERGLWSPGVDARTGKVIVSESQSTDGVAYDDVAGSWAQPEIEKLARCGIGYDGGSFAPERALTQWDLVCLLASLRGWRLDPEKATADERDSAYNAVYSMGALKRAERSDDAALDRGTLVRMLLDCAGVGSVARLQGIFTCAYADRAQIPADQLGFAALAQGYGLVRGDAYAAGSRATRAMAAAMLCRLMEREIG